MIAVPRILGIFLDLIIYLLGFIALKNGLCRKQIPSFNFKLGVYLFVLFAIFNYFSGDFYHYAEYLDYLSNKYSIPEYVNLRNIKPSVVKYINIYEEKQKNKIFLKRGLSVLSDFHEILIRTNVNYSVVFGTLLDAVREKGFIKHDLDIDIGVWNTIDRTKLHSSLSEGGFKLVRCYETDNGNFGCEETYIKNGVSIDVFYFYPYDDVYANTTVLVPFEGYKDLTESIKIKGGAMPIQLILPFGKEIELIQFHNIKVSAIKNRLDFIVSRYGNNWMIPDPTFVYPKMGDAKCRYRTDKIAKLITNFKKSESLY